MSKGSKKRLLIVGFGNVGRSVLASLPRYPDLECVGIVTRNPARVGLEVENTRIYHLAGDWYNTAKADVAILCGGSKRDLPIHGPMFARHYNTVCSFDTHGHIGPYIDPESGQKKIGYYRLMDRIAAGHSHTAMICQGWDPGIFSMMRALFTSCLGGAKAAGFYGLTAKGGLSMGHSDAIRTLPGVKDARQYTHAMKDAIEAIRRGRSSELPPYNMHWRECYVVAEKRANLRELRHRIENMPEYFLPYRTTVRFVTQRELNRKHRSMPHDGLVVCAAEHGHMEFRNEWKSNPMGTAGILLAFARAAVRFNAEGNCGAFTALDVPINYLLPRQKDFLKFI